MTLRRGVENLQLPTTRIIKLVACPAEPFFVDNSGNARAATAIRNRTSTTVPKLSRVWLRSLAAEAVMQLVNYLCNIRRTVLAEHSKSAAIRRRLAPPSRIRRIASTCPGWNFRGGPRVLPC